MAWAAQWFLFVSGTAAVVAAFFLDPSSSRQAAEQVWPAFALVAGLLLVGLVADEDGLFAAAGTRMARMAPNGVVLYAGAVVLIGTVTALLNLDTSVVFLTPVLVHAARSRGELEEPLLAACLLLSNAGSLMLPGSNLTNIIVLGHLHLSGGEFFARMALPSAVSLLVTASIIAGWMSRRPRLPEVRRGRSPGTVKELRPGLGVASVVVVTVLVVVLRSPALPVLAAGTLAIGIRVASNREEPRRVLEVLGLPVLAGLFGIATALGALGRQWSGPAWLLSHLGAFGSAFAAAISSVLVNNLPAASLLAARIPPHPFALLVGLDIGPNFFVTGSLAWVLWIRTARVAGADPPLSRTIVLGVVSAPLAMAAALAVLAASGSG